MNKLQKIAEETIEAVEAGIYTNPSGKIISLDKMMAYCIHRSKLYKPTDRPESDNQRLEYNNCKINISPEIVVTKESSLEAAARLAKENPCLLNFASAKHAGGGFLRGAPAQEESIARSSGLYHTLIRHQEYYEENKRSQAKNIGLYLNYAIYSPDVPVFRNDAGDWLEEPYLVSVVTSPAPNRHAILEDEDNKKIFIDDYEAEEMMEIDIKKTFSIRMKQVLSIMAAEGHRTIILGAWGCGVFGNDPLVVAELFRDNLKNVPFFDSVVFAILDKEDSYTFRSFSQIFSS